MATCRAAAWFLGAYLVIAFPFGLFYGLAGIVLVAGLFISADFLERKLLGTRKVHSFAERLFEYLEGRVAKKGSS
jgi:hypothetical protein